MYRPLSIGLIVLLAAAIPLLSGNVSGEHYGELKTIEAEIDFFYPSGTAIYDKTGSYFIVHGVTYYSADVYPEEYWGEYPLYLSGLTAPVVTSIRNTGPREVEKQTLVSEAYYIHPDGSKKATRPLYHYEEKAGIIEARKGETVEANIVMVLPTDIMTNGFFQIKLYHHENEKPASSLVMKKEGCFCPREYLDTLEVYHAAY